MDFENELEQKVGTGIKVISIIYFIINGFGIFGFFTTFFMLDAINSEYKKLGMPELTKGALIFSLILTILIIIGCALILAKNKIGIFLYVAAIAGNLIYGIVNSTSNTALTIISSLILPALYLFFIFKQKELYFGEK